MTENPLLVSTKRFWEEETVRGKLIYPDEQVIRFIKKNAHKEDTILDFGCGSGRDTKYFLEHDFKVEAMDGSEELCKAASKFTGITVKHQLFQNWASEAKYNGIWACSSILHLNKSELKQVIGNIQDALLPSGIFYTSFKYGKFEGIRNGRYFTDLTEASFAELINEVTGFEIIEEWITSDVRPGREEEKWLNVILKKI